MFPGFGAELFLVFHSDTNLNILVLHNANNIWAAMLKQHEDIFFTLSND